MNDSTKTNTRTILDKLNEENLEPGPSPEEAEALRVLQTMGEDLIAAVWNPNFPNTDRFLTLVTSEMFVDSGNTGAGCVWAKILNHYEKTGEIPTRKITRHLLLEELREDDPFADEALGICEYKGDYRNAKYIESVLDESFSKIEQREHFERTLFGEAAQQALAEGNFDLLKEIMRKSINAAPTTNDKRFKFISPSEIERITNEERAWLVEGLFEDRKATIWGGPKKAFKTATLCDLIVSLATATPFLNHFPVADERTVCFVSAESDETDIWPRFRSIAESKGVKLPEDRIRTHFGAPKLSDERELHSLIEAVKEEGATVLIIDPMYLTLLRGSSNKQAGNLFDTGQSLGGIGDICRDAGITPILCHHTRKTSTVGCDLDDLAYTGLAEWARQSIMLKPKGKRTREGGSTLLMRTHGFARGGLYEVTIDEGTWDDLKWNVTIKEASEAALEEKRATIDQQVDALREAFVSIAEKEETPLEYLWCSKRQLRDEMGCSGAKITKIVDHALEKGFVEIQNAGTNQARYRRIQ